MKTTRTIAAVLFAAGLAVTVWYGPGVHARVAPKQLPVLPSDAGAVPPRSGAEAASNSADELDRGVRVVADAWALIEKNFADTASADRAFYQGAIPGMLGTLDPHSSFLTPAEYADMQRKQRAQYFGVGMMITVMDGNTVAMSRSPARPRRWRASAAATHRLGVDGVDALGMDSQKVADMLRGPRGTRSRHREPARLFGSRSAW